MAFIHAPGLLGPTRPRTRGTQPGPRRRRRDRGGPPRGGREPPPAPHPAGTPGAGRATTQPRPPTVTARALEANAIELVAASAVPVVISSRSDIVLASGAAGVNLPERDITVHDARALLGQRLIGRSVHSLKSALEAEQDGADFVIFGPVFPTPTHPGSAGLGLIALGEVAQTVTIPVLAIGGVDAERGAECLAAGAAGYAAIRLFREDPAP